MVALTMQMLTDVLKMCFGKTGNQLMVNKYARQYMAGMIGFASGDVDTSTLNSNLVQALRQGRDLETYMIWASSYSDEKQNIGFITQGLQELASSFWSRA